MAHKQAKRGGGAVAQRPRRHREHTRIGFGREYLVLLGVAERLTLIGPGLWPQTATYDDGRVIQAVQKALALTDAEKTAWGVEDRGNGNYKWETEYPDPSLPEPAAGDEDTRPLLPFDQEREFNLGTRATALIIQGLEALERQGGLGTAEPTQHNPNPSLTLFQKFVRPLRAAKQAEESAVDAEIAALLGETPDVPPMEFPAPDPPIADVGAEDANAPEHIPGVGAA